MGPDGERLLRRRSHPARRLTRTKPRFSVIACRAVGFCLAVSRSNLSSSVVVKALLQLRLVYTAAAALSSPALTAPQPESIRPGFFPVGPAREDEGGWRGVCRFRLGFLVPSQRAPPCRAPTKTGGAAASPRRACFVPVCGERVCQGVLWMFRHGARASREAGRGFLARTRGR